LYQQVIRQTLFLQKASPAGLSLEKALMARVSAGAVIGRLSRATLSGVKHTLYGWRRFDRRQYFFLNYYLYHINTRLILKFFRFLPKLV